MLNKIVLAIIVFIIQTTSNQSFAECLPSTKANCNDTQVIDPSELAPAQGVKARWRPELEISYMAGDQDNSLVFLTARFARLRNSISFAGIEATATFAEADLSSSKEFVHVQGTFSGLVGLPVSSTSTYDLRTTLALGVIFGGVQDADGDDIDYFEGIFGFQFEPRVVFEIKGVAPQFTPIVSLGYLQTLDSQPEFGSFRLGIGLAF